VSGTQAHSWIMFFENESEAFQAYAKAMPNNCVFLVDTYNSLEGVRHSIDVAKQLRKNGHEMIGVRLDSGDRVALSIETRRMLDKAGFATAKIVCSGDLDEHVITAMKRHGAKIDIWGVGTKLTTGQPDAALGGIYKLGAVRHPGGQWQYRIKVSDERAKTSSPGLLQVRRFHQPGARFVADAIYEIDHQVSKPCVIVQLQTEQETEIPANMEYSNLLVPIFRKGELVYQVPNLAASRERTRQQLSRLPPEIVALDNPRVYTVGLEKTLHELRSTLIEQAGERQAK
jgi:nicotinate phosphoribosyltransferase